jgi:restriction system protein
MADENVAPAPTGVSSKSKITALLLCIFLGTLGVHRFYVGKVGTGVVWLLTGGVFFVGWIVDIIVIATGKFKDGQGLVLA